VCSRPALDALRVIDAARDDGITSFGAGGISMGGDIAIALAGIDPRIGRVADEGAVGDCLAFLAGS
jgi:cephalosporin-C deacetylase-like acetyl esterase